MATMVKEKRKERKKKDLLRSSETRDLSPVAIEPLQLEDIQRLNESIETEPLTNIVLNTDQLTQQECKDILVQKTDEVTIQESSSNATLVKESLVTQHFEVDTAKTSIAIDNLGCKEKDSTLTKEVPSNYENCYSEVKSELDRLTIPYEVTKDITEARQCEMERSDAYLCTVQEESEAIAEVTTPSAPCIEEVPESLPCEEVVVETRARVQCMPIEDAMNLLGGREMEEVMILSEREEEIINSDSGISPHHPLIDLLSTFRFSLTALERERINLDNCLAEEEKLRSQLWLIEKRSVYVSEKCQCGTKVGVQATYEHAEFLKGKLPKTMFQSEKLLKDVQESYCHYQHAALLAHYQIEELISETIQSNKCEIRDVLSLILQALRLSDSAPVVLVSALQRWASALAAALLDERDVRQILFLMHHLFRQYRSVQWAARVLHVNVDATSPPRVLALLQLLLARPRLEPALECTEESEEAWEEVDKHGVGGAVSEGTLREKDLLALFHSFPLRDLVARLVLFTHNDLKKARAHEWGDRNGGRGVLRACYGVRALLHVLRTATSAHASYERLRHSLRELAAHALHALASLHLVSRTFYEANLEEKISAELEAAFSSGFLLFGTSELYKLPATLLTDYTASDYCVAYIVALHDKNAKQLDLLSVEMPVLSCEMRVRIITQAAVDRQDHHELARMVLDFLLQTGIKRKSVSCKDGCETMAKECVRKILQAHPYLHTIALHVVAELNVVESLDPGCISSLDVHTWRPDVSEIRAVLDDWACRCPQLLKHLLLELDYTPHSGISLDVQLTIGSWLCVWVERLAAPPEWAWRVVRKLRVHSSTWCGAWRGEAPPPAAPHTLFSTAYALLATSWGHSIPVICSEGVDGLHRLALSRPREAVHCLAGVMLVMAHSPESIAFTPKFSEVLAAILNSGPTLMQRALGRSAASGSELLLRLILAQLETEYEGVPRASILSAWLHVLWRAGVVSGAAVADTVACATRLWPHLDAYCTALLMEDNWKEQVNHAVREAGTAPLLCECTLRAAHAQRAARSAAHARLCAALCRQRARGERIHVDNAIAQVGGNMLSEDLIIYRTATAAISSPMCHPSHLTLWRLFMHLYLQRDPENMHESTPPVGPLFFSGLIKSRTLAQIKRRLQETITYHHNEIESLKSSRNTTEIKEEKPTSSTFTSNIKTDNSSLLSELSLIDLTVESSDDSDSEDEKEEHVKDTSPISESSVPKKEVPVFNLIAYHSAAEKLLSEYVCWLDEGDRVRAMPHHTDIARFIPGHALESAWERAVSRPQPSPDLDSFPLPAPSLPSDRAPPQTPFHNAVEAILSISGRDKRFRKPRIKSPLEDVNVKDAQALLKIVENHLKDIEKLANEWCAEVSKVSSLNTKLWQLVSVLRVQRALPPVRKQCPNKCRIHNLVIPAKEWCISVDAERNVAENRSSARAALRRLARPRPHAARTAAALHTAARVCASSECAVRILERVWRCAGAHSCSTCAPAHDLLVALAETLAERWVCHEGNIAAQLMTAWSCGGSSTTLQHQLCGTLVSPRRLPRDHCLPVYIAVLHSHLPSHTIFSYLSKFDMASWSKVADPKQRLEILDALLQAAQQWGWTPAQEHSMLVELLGMQTTALLAAREICGYIVKCARASIAGHLPAAHWLHVAKAVELHAKEMSFDQLGHLLRELGLMWWQVRTSANKTRSATTYGAYAQNIATMLNELLKAFVTAGNSLSYAADKVSWYAWSGVQEAWSPWISPHSDNSPLLPCTGELGVEQYSPMLRHFVAGIQLIMDYCPGGETNLLQLVFDWCVQTYLSVQGIRSTAASEYTHQESLVQASAMLVELAQLPWSDHQWFYGKCVQRAVQISSSSDRELTSWCCATWHNTSAHTMLRDASDGTLVPQLAALLRLFTGTTLPNSHQVLEQACYLPWERLPEPALDEALDNFFIVHHNPAVPYHDVLQFRVLLVVAGLSPSPDAVLRVQRGGARARGVAQWVRAACAPTLAAHAHAHALRLLRVITDLVPYIGDKGDEIEQLLSRGIIIMCIQPAAAAALPVWLSWVSSTTPRLVAASISAAGTLTAFDYFATFADAAIHSMLNCDAPLSWHDVISRWSECPWHEARPLVQRGRLHAAYGCLVTHKHDLSMLRDTIAALLTSEIHFVELEAIVAVWICVACRVSLSCASVCASSGVECGAAARTLLTRWSTPPRRSILSVVTLAVPTDRPTDRHSLLCRYAECILSPSEDTRRSFDIACTSTLGATNDVTSWALTPTLNKLVRLAIRLYPKHQKYFEYELSLSPNE